MFRLTFSVIATVTLLVTSYVAFHHQPAMAANPSLQVADGTDPIAPPWPLSPAA